jgi:protoporphyrinogen oxidase
MKVVVCGAGIAGLALAHEMGKPASGVATAEVS